MCHLLLFGYALLLFSFARSHICTQIEPDSRAWFVKLIGEGATDAGTFHPSRSTKIVLTICSKGGPYYEILSQMCKDIQSPPVSLFIHCPNAQIATDQEGSISNRDKVCHFLFAMFTELIEFVVVHTQPLKKEYGVLANVHFCGEIIGDCAEV